MVTHFKISIPNNRKIHNTSGFLAVSSYVQPIGIHTYTVSVSVSEIHCFSRAFGSHSFSILTQFHLLIAYTHHVCLFVLLGFDRRTITSILIVIRIPVHHTISQSRNTPCSVNIVSVLKHVLFHQLKSHSITWVGLEPISILLTQIPLIHMSLFRRTFCSRYQTQISLNNASPSWNTLETVLTHPHPSQPNYQPKSTRVLFYQTQFLISHFNCKS